MKRLKSISCLLIGIFAVITLKAQSIQDLSDYPLHVAYKHSAKPVVVYLTGDGGWNSFSESIVNELVKNGYPVIALDTRKYFWNQKTPDLFAKDMKEILSVYLKAWNKDSFSIIGYSFGADVGSFLPSRLADHPSGKINSVILLSPGFSTGYVVKIKNMLNFGSTDREKYEVYPELLKSKAPVWCIFGLEEKSDFYKAIKETALIHKLNIPGSHRYDDNVPVLMKAILSGL